MMQGSSLTPENGAEEYHRLRQSLSMLQFSDELQMRLASKNSKNSLGSGISNFIHYKEVILLILFTGTKTPTLYYREVININNS